MNKFNPIIPPECSLSLLYHRWPGRRISIPFVVFSILTVHVMFLGGLLMQGCKQVERNARLTSEPANLDLATPSPAPMALGAVPETIPPFPAAPASSPAPLPELSDSTVPKPSSRSDLIDGPATYLIRPGDTLGKIAKAQGTTLRSLRSANRLLSDRIVVGQTLALPKVSAQQTTRTRSGVNANPAKDDSDL